MRRLPRVRRKKSRRKYRRKSPTQIEGTINESMRKMLLLHNDTSGTSSARFVAKQESNVDVKKVQFYYLGPYKAIDDVFPSLVRKRIPKNRRRTSGHSYGFFFILEIFHHPILFRQTTIAFLANGNTWETQKIEIQNVLDMTSGNLDDWWNLPRAIKKVAGIIVRTAQLGLHNACSMSVLLQ